MNMGYLSLPAAGRHVVMERDLPHARSALIGDDISLTLRIRNVVASARVAESLPVVELAATVPGAELDRRVSKLVVRIGVPRATALIFGSGKVVLTGLRAPEEAAPALGALIEVLRDAGAAVDEPVPAPTIVNLVASGTLGERVALHRLAISRNLDRIEFDPEQFPGLVYRSIAGPVALVFGTGSLVITGARTDEGARAAAAEVLSIVAAAGAFSRDQGTPGAARHRLR